MSATVHVIGAGLAGLAAAVRLAGAGLAVALHEAAPQAGGRCRSYVDPVLGLTIDNGNHLVLSGNHATLAFLAQTGGAGRLVGPARAEVAFLDRATGERWTLRPNAGRLPWWILHPRRRVPDTRAADYLPLLRLAHALPQQRIDAVIACEGRLYERLLRPFLLAVLNTEPGEASAGLAGAVIRETLARGGAACRPLIAAEGLGAAFIDPALRYLERRGVRIRFGHRLRGMAFAPARVRALDFGEEQVALAEQDAVVLAVPAPVAAALLPGLAVPTAFNAIVNAHFRIVSPPGFPPLLGLLNATVEWIFAFPERLAVTVSAADRLLDVPRADLAARLWHDVAAATGLPPALPPWQIVRERRATFAATPEQERLRPPARTPWENLMLAGDWTATGLPATIEGAIRSGNTAAGLLLDRHYRLATPVLSPTAP